MYVTPVGFILFPLAIWLLWRASKTARFNLNQVVFDKETRRLKKKSNLTGEDCKELDNFLSDSKKKIYRAGLFILASAVTLFCLVFFTIETPISSHRSSAWIVALCVMVYYGMAISFQFVIPLLDLKQLESDRKALLSLDD